MAKFYGPIGYSETVEIKPGVWKDQIIERNYTCEVIRNNTKWTESSDSTNDNLNVNHQFSILADPFAYQNFHSMKYIAFMGATWKITNVEVKYPRLILTVGGVYNG